MLKIRRTALSDVEKINVIFNIARRYMASYGNASQWAGTYPNKDNVLEDIKNNNAYTVVDDDKVVAYFAFVIGEDPHYGIIENGTWLNNEKYGTIHRIASDNETHGIFKMVLDYCFTIIDNIRIDTHKNNVVMRHLIEKNNFKYCGIVYMEDNTPRMAYQLCKKS